MAGGRDIFNSGMEQAEFFKRNSTVEDLFMLVGQCIRHCGTISRSSLSLEDEKCLENCGYNKAFLNAHMKDFVEKTTWGDEERTGTFH